MTTASYAVTGMTCGYSVREAVGEAGFDLTGAWSDQGAVDGADVAHGRDDVRGRFVRATRGGVSS
jgi:hypothetical protein